MYIQMTNEEIIKKVVNDGSWAYEFELSDGYSGGEVESAIEMALKLKDHELSKEFLSDLGCIWNNLDDDLTMDLGIGENGCKTYKDSYSAVKKYTLKVVKEKYKKWNKIIKTNKREDKNENKRNQGKV